MSHLATQLLEPNGSLSCLHEYQVRTSQPHHLVMAALDLATRKETLGPQSRDHRASLGQEPPEQRNENKALIGWLSNRVYNVWPGPNDTAPEFDRAHSLPVETDHCVMLL
jgi:hypothetical protein